VTESDAIAASSSLLLFTFSLSFNTFLANGDPNLAARADPGRC
jgi:hypothetical protein